MIKISRKYIQRLIRENILNMTNMIPDYSDPIQNFIRIRDNQIASGTYPMTSTEERLGSWNGEKIKKENIVDNKIILQINNRFNKKWFYAKNIDSNDYFTIEKTNFIPSGGNNWISLASYSRSIEKIKELGELVIVPGAGLRRNIIGMSDVLSDKEEEIKKYKLQGRYATASRQNTFEKLISKLWDKGYRNTFFFLGLAGVIAKESGFVYNYREKRYGNTSYSRMQEIFLSNEDKRGNISPEQWSSLKAAGIEAPFNYFYGGEIPDDLISSWPQDAMRAAENKAIVLGNIISGDGDKYRGGGLIQNTGRENWEKFGLDIDKINDENAVINAAIKHLEKFLERIGYGVDSINNINNLKTGINVVADAVAGGRTTTRGRKLATKYLKIPCIKYDDLNPFDVNEINVAIDTNTSIVNTQSNLSTQYKIEPDVNDNPVISKGDIFVVNGVSFKSEPAESAGDVAYALWQSAQAAGQEGVSAWETTDKGREWIGKNIYDASKPGEGKKWKKHLGTRNESHWSSWFFTVVYKGFESEGGAGSNYYDYGADEGIKTRQKVLNNPDDYINKIVFMTFDIDEAPLYKGDAVFAHRGSKSGTGFKGIGKPTGPAHMRILIDDSGTVCGGNEEQKVGIGKVELNNDRTLKPGQKRIGNDVYCAVYKRVRVLG